ncbi:MAG TPA: hypothetical protein VIC56_08495 [Gemmatimonadota bacterium]
MTGLPEAPDGRVTGGPEAPGRAGAGAEPRHERIPLAARARWEAALRGVPHAIAHTWGWCRALHSGSAEDAWLYRFEAGEGRVVCPFVERRMPEGVDLVTPYGFSGFAGAGPRHDFPRRWAEFARAEGYVCGYVGLHPVLADPSNYDPADAHVHHQLYLLDLTLGSERLFAGLSTNRRRQLRDWEAIRSAIRLDREPLTEFLLARYAEFFREKGATAAYAFTPATMAGLAKLDGVLVVGAGRGSTIEAVSLFGYTPYAADFLFNVALPEGRRHSAALIWYAVQALREAGAPVLNLGGGVRDGDSLAEFKRRFGAAQAPFVALKQVYDPAAYARACRGAGADPRDRSGYFPAYRRPGAVTEAEAGAARSVTGVSPTPQAVERLP